MSIIPLLATSLNRRDEEPNIQLAIKIVSENNAMAIIELVENLGQKNKNIRHDCIKTLYEAAYRKPEMVADYWNNFLPLLDHKDNRMQWGAMTALAAIVEQNTDAALKSLPVLAKAADAGSVITKDGYVAILVILIKAGKQEVFEMLNEQLLKSATNQLPKYAEMACAVIDDKDKAKLRETLLKRRPDMTVESKLKRLDKVIKKIS
ncbi:MAG: hypothetical protein H6607_01495 [Flavobacteriales bacterium]|nr:hypothetical protein [Flavobacteriales bacterium]